MFDVVALTARETWQLIAGIVSLGTGALIIVFPAVLNYIVAVYLLVVGVVLVLAAFN